MRSALLLTLLIAGCPTTGDDDLVVDPTPEPTPEPCLTGGVLAGCQDITEPHDCPDSGYAENLGALFWSSQGAFSDAPGSPFRLHFEADEQPLEVVIEITEEVGQSGYFDYAVPSPIRAMVVDHTLPDAPVSHHHLCAGRVVISDHGASTEGTVSGSFYLQLDVDGGTCFPGEPPFEVGGEFQFLPREQASCRDGVVSDVDNCEDPGDAIGCVDDSPPYVCPQQDFELAASSDNAWTTTGSFEDADGPFVLSLEAGDQGYGLQITVPGGVYEGQELYLGVPAQFSAVAVRSSDSAELPQLCDGYVKVDAYEPGPGGSVNGSVYVELDADDCGTTTPDLQIGADFEGFRYCP